MKNGKDSVGSGTDLRPHRSSEVEMVCELMEAVGREETVLTYREGEIVYKQKSDCPLNVGTIRESSGRNI